MRGVEVSVAMHAMVGSPAGFRKSFLAKFHTAVVWCFAIIEFDTAQVMLVSALHVNEFAKKTLTHHLQYGHHISPVTDIFHHHHLGALCGCCIHYIPVSYTHLTLPTKRIV